MSTANPGSAERNPVEEVIAEFQFRDEEKTLFLALSAALLVKFDDELIASLLVRTEEVIPRKILDAAITRLDELMKNGTTEAQPSSEDEDWCRLGAEQMFLRGE